MSFFIFLFLVSFSFSLVVAFCEGTKFYANGVLVVLEGVPKLF